MKTNRAKKAFLSYSDFRAQEHQENFIKASFGAACVKAKKLGWTWSFEGDMIWVKTPETEIGCSDRMDFVALVGGK